jgi:hypothetical protein
MSNTNTGGPAFPSAQLDTTTLTYKYVEGMTLRDYFAAKAMQGFISRGGHYECAFDAARAYAFADAMLKAREA